MDLLVLIVYVFYLYLLLGLIFGLWFVFRGVNGLDPAAKSARWHVRLLFLPGSALLWPVLWRNLLRKSSKN
jgi:hypothetical protein